MTNEEKVEEFVNTVVKTLELHSDEIIRIYDTLNKMNSNMTQLEELNEKLMGALLRQQMGMNS